MATRNVVLTETQSELVDRLVASGRYQNASEALRAGLRLLEREETELGALRDRLAIGLEQARRGDLAEGLVDLRIGNADAGFIGTGNLQLAHDPAIEYLPLELGARRQLLRIVCVLGLDGGDLALQLAAQDDVTIENGDDAIELFGRHQLRLGKWRGKGEEQDQGGEQLVHAHEVSAGAGRNGAGL